METMASDLRFYRDELGLTRVSSEIADWHEENMYVYARLSWNQTALAKGFRRFLSAQLRPVRRW